MPMRQVVRNEDMLQKVDTTACTTHNWSFKTSDCVETVTGLSRYAPLAPRSIKLSQQSSLRSSFALLSAFIRRNDTMIAVDPTTDSEDIVMLVTKLSPLSSSHMAALALSAAVMLKSHCSED